MQAMPAKEVILTILLSILPIPSRGFGMGPPLGACVDMWPKQHGADAQTSDPPYTITTSKDTYSPGEILTITVSTTENEDIKFFEGLFVQARRANCSHKEYEEAVGTFALPDDETFLGLLHCQGGPNSAVGHIAHAHIVERKFSWTAPASSVGHIYFRATVARRQKTFWTKVTSEFIRDPLVSSSPQMCPIQTKETVNTCANSATSWNLSCALILLVMMIWTSKF